MKLEIARVTVLADIDEADSSVQFNIDVKAKNTVQLLGLEHAVMGAAAAFVRVFSESQGGLEKAENRSVVSSPEMDGVIAELLAKKDWPTETDGSTVIVEEAR